MGRNALLIGLLLAALLGTLALLLQSPDSSPTDGPGPTGIEIGVEDVPQSTVLGSGTESGQTTERNTTVADSTNSAPPATDLHQVILVDAKSEETLAGISAYQGETLLAGPSQSDGVLAFAPARGRRTTFWAPGWVPLEFRSGKIPTGRVYLRAADASIEVLLDNLAPDEGILQSRLEPMDWSAPAGAAWAAPLERTSPARAVGEALAPGRYQVYIWVGLFQGQGISLAPVEILLTAGENEVIRLDASVKPDDETDS